MKGTTQCFASISSESWPNDNSERRHRRRTNMLYSIHLFQFTNLLRYAACRPNLKRFPEIGLAHQLQRYGHPRLATAFARKVTVCTPCPTIRIEIDQIPRRLRETVHEVFSRELAVLRTEMTCAIEIDHDLEYRGVDPLTELRNRARPTFFPLNREAQSRRRSSNTLRHDRWHRSRALHDWSCFVRRARQLPRQLAHAGKAHFGKEVEIVFIDRYDLRAMLT